MNIFKRIFKIGQSEANAVIDNMEDPIKLTEQGIRDLKTDLSKNLESLAQVKALAIRARNDNENYKNKAVDYQNKAVIIIKKGQSGELTAEESDRLAQEALLRKDENMNLANSSALDAEKIEGSVQQLEANIAQLKSTISSWENELKTLKARARVSKAKTSLNKQMAQLDSSGTVTMLERMKEKVQQEEALSEAYGDIASNYKPLDKAIDEAADSSKYNAKTALEELKNSMKSNKEE